MGPPPTARQGGAGGPDGGGAPACSSASAATHPSADRVTSPAVTAAAASPTVACAHVLLASSSASDAPPSAHYALHETNSQTPAPAPLPEASGVGGADCNFMNCTGPEGTPPPLADVVASPHLVVGFATLSPPRTGSLEHTLPAPPTPSLLDPLALTAGPHAILGAGSPPLSSPTATSRADPNWQVAPATTPANLDRPDATRTECNKRACSAVKFCRPHTACVRTKLRLRCRTAGYRSHLAPTFRSR